MLYLKQSTAVTLLIGPFIDDTDGKTAETGLTLAQADIRLSKNGGNMAQKNDATGCTHDELGYYTCPLDATDTNTLGHLKLMVHQAGSLPVFHEFMVLPAGVYDSLVSGSDYLDVYVTNKTGYSLSSAGIDAIIDDPVEGSVTLRQAVRVMLSVLAGKASGGGTATAVYRDVNDTANRVTATIDADGNRTAVTLNTT